MNTPDSSATSSRERIRQAAVRLFARKGFAATGLRELAAAADVNLAMINYFFGSKKNLLKEILDVFFSAYLEIARTALAADDGPETRLELFIRRAVVFFESHRDYLLVAITELPRDDPEIIEYKAAWGRQLIDLIDRRICRPITEQSGQPVPPLVIGPMLTSMMASRFLFAPVVEEIMPSAGRTVAMEKYIATITNTVLHGIIGQTRSSDDPA